MSDANDLRRIRLSRRKLGVCERCGQPRTGSGSLDRCVDCLTKARQEAQERARLKRWALDTAPAFDFDSEKV